MARGIVKIRDRYCEWSTVADAPITKAVPFEKAVELWGEHRVLRACANGHSFVDEGPEEAYWAYNRAGPDESCLIEDELWELLTAEETEE